MKIIMLVHADGCYVKGPTVPSDFNVETWAESRRQAFRILNIVRLEIIDL